MCNTHVICNSITLVRLKRRTKRTVLFFSIYRISCRRNGFRYSDVSQRNERCKLFLAFSRKLCSCVPRNKTLVIFGSAQYKTFQRDLLERKKLFYAELTFRWILNWYKLEIFAFQYSKILELFLLQFVNGANVNSALFKLVQLGREQIFFAYFYQIMYCAFK